MGIKNAAELTINSGNGNRALVFQADSINVVFSIYPRRSTRGTEPTDKQHMVTTVAASATTVTPPPAKRAKDILDELLTAHTTGDSSRGHCEVWRREHRNQTSEFSV